MSKRCGLLCDVERNPSRGRGVSRSHPRGAAGDLVTGSHLGQPRLHPGITQEVAPNESQRGPKTTTSEALVYEASFVAHRLWCRFRKGS
jgi:hypothetical protein